MKVLSSLPEQSTCWKEEEDEDTRLDYETQSLLPHFVKWKCLGRWSSVWIKKYLQLSSSLTGGQPHSCRAEGSNDSSADIVWPLASFSGSLHTGLNDEWWEESSEKWAVHLWLYSFYSDTAVDKQSSAIFTPDQVPHLPSLVDWAQCTPGPKSRDPCCPVPNPQQLWTLKSLRTCRGWKMVAAEGGCVSYSPSPLKKELN